MTYGYTNRNHRGENHVFSFIIYHSLTVSSWVSKQPHWAVMRTACCHCAGAAGACASRAGTCRAAEPALAALGHRPQPREIRGDAGRSGRMRENPRGCAHVAAAPAASSPRHALTRSRRGVKLSGRSGYCSGELCAQFPP